MARYAYKTVVAAKDDDALRVDHELNYYGSQGYRLVSTTSNNGETRYLLECAEE